MPANRFFIDLPLRGVSEVSLKGPEFHHLARVMRIQIGEKVGLTNGKGELVEATLLQIYPDQALLKLETHTSYPSPENTLILAQALPRFKALEWIVEKGTELGLSELWVFPGERSEKRGLSKLERDRLNSLCIAAIKQSGNPFLPALIYKPPLSKWLEMNKPIASMLYGDPHALQTVICKSKQTVFFNGPEKGFSKEEVGQFHRWKAQAVSLNRYTLRSETAAIVAIGQLNLINGK